MADSGISNPDLRENPMADTPKMSNDETVKTVSLSIVIPVCIAIATSAWALATTVIGPRIANNEHRIEQLRAKTADHDVMIERLSQQNVMILARLNEIRDDVKALK